MSRFDYPDPGTDPAYGGGLTPEPEYEPLADEDKTDPRTTDEIVGVDVEDTWSSAQLAARFGARAHAMIRAGVDPYVAARLAASFAARALAE